MQEPRTNNTAEYGDSCATRFPAHVKGTDGTATPAVEIGLQTQVSRRMEDMPHLHATFDAVHPAFLYGTYMQY
jgi:hypothetical protein